MFIRIFCIFMLLRPVLQVLILTKIYVFLGVKAANSLHYLRFPGVTSCCGLDKVFAAILVTGAFLDITQQLERHVRR